MLATAVIVFRETLEAALIISIVLAATRGIENRSTWIGGGVVAGLLGALLIAGAAGTIANAFEGMGQELFNAAVLLVAALMLGWHHLWMAEHGRALAGQLTSLSRSVVSGNATLGALALAVGLAVLREGAETVLFIQGLVTTQSPRDVALGLGLGAAMGVVVGALLYTGLVRIPVRRFFALTGWLIALLAAGLAANAARFLEQADALPTSSQALWDTSDWLNESSLPGQLLHVLVGYTASPSALQLGFYVATLAILIVATRWRAAAPKERAPNPA